MEDQNLDLKITHFLFDTLPPTATIGRVKMLATQIKDEISTEWDAMKATATTASTY